MSLAAMLETDVADEFLSFRPGKGLLVLSIEMLQRSVAVVVDCTDVAPV